MSDDNGILLGGLDGSNPLAFLAALGTLRTLTLALPDETVRMSWEVDNGAWRPRVWCSLAGDGDAIINNFYKSLVQDRSSHPTRFIDYKSEKEKEKGAVSNKEAVEFYQFVRRGGPIKSEQDAWIASLTNDIHSDATSPLQLTRSDYFAGNIDQVLANTDAKALQRTLFEKWRYDDKLAGQSLHLEPSEDRRHAYQWDKPSGDPNRNTSGNMLGANRLAIEALPLFLGLPSINPARLFMAGWTGVRSDNARWTWPVWRHKASVSVVSSLLSLPELQEERPDRTILNQMGIGAAFRCRRILVEKTPNLTPSIAVA